MLVLLVLALFYAGLSPFDLARRNGVEWRPESRALGFDGSGIVFSRGTFQFEEGARELSIETWVVPGDAPPWKEGTILSFVDERAVAPLALSSRYGSLTLRYRILEDRVETTRAISVGNALEEARPTHIVVTSGAGGTRVYLDGEAPDRLRSRQSLVDAPQGFRGRLVLGNSPQGSSGWVGEVRGLALYERALSELEVVEHAARIQDQGMRSLMPEPQLRALYVFDSPSRRSVPNLISAQGALSVPALFEAQRLEVLMFPPPVSPLRSPRFRQDILRNLLGFIPLGVLLMWIGRARGASEAIRFAVVCGLGAGVSLFIELGQALLPTRYSSVLDLALNVAGTALGAGLVVAWRRIWRARGA